MVDTINELADLSRKLNQKSDQINAIIESINAKLVKLNLGVEVWVEGDNTWLGYDKTDLYKPSSNTTSRTYVGSEWQLATRRYSGNDWMASSLLEASRETRIGALKLVPRLLDALKEKATDMIATIEEAEESAKKL